MRWQHKGMFRPYPRMDISHATPLAEMVVQAKRILEFGSGGSTLWLATLAPDAEILSVEHDTDWHSKVSGALEAFRFLFDSAVVSLSHEEHADEYVHYGEGLFDLVIVDGKHEWRVMCIERAWPKVKAGGSLWLHDSQDKTYAAGVEFLKQATSVIDEWPADREGSAILRAVKK